jgi:hypothetical protein
VRPLLLSHSAHEPLYFLFFSAPHHTETTGNGLTLLQAHSPPNDEHLVGNLTGGLQAYHSLFLRSSPAPSSLSLIQCLTSIGYHRGHITHPLPAADAGSSVNQSFCKVRVTSAQAPHVFFFSWPPLPGICNPVSVVQLPGATIDVMASSRWVF